MGWDGVEWGCWVGGLCEEAELQQQADEGSDAVDGSALEEQAVKLAAAAAQDVRLLRTQRRRGTTSCRWQGRRAPTNTFDIHLRIFSLCPLVC